ncbi:MAG: DUF3422 domain-containing protein [Yoonia sp.]
MNPIADHPSRHAMADELHARPFAKLGAPACVAHLAMSSDANDRAHLCGLLDHFGAAHPDVDATHYSGQLDRMFLKWESHTEFVTYTLFDETGVADDFDSIFDMFPMDWLQSGTGVRLASAVIRVENGDADDEVLKQSQAWFAAESLAMSRVLDDCLVVASDFRIDLGGHMRMAVFARMGTGQRRIGRVVQRLCEIETYRAMAMLGLAQARDMGRDLARLDGQLTELVARLNSDHKSDATLGQLLETAASLEQAAAQSSYRFGATRAYEAIVNQRIDILRETRFYGRQTWAEFMMRRFDPAMRTVQSTGARLQGLTDRAARASDLLRTRVDVERSAQNQTLLSTMNDRADRQLRLQRTVEGLSVVAISYYAVNLVLYLLGPLGVGKTVLAAGVTPCVVLSVWLALRRIQRKLH